jgi:hypothetical protein
MTRRLNFGGDPFGERPNVPRVNRLGVVELEGGMLPGFVPPDYVPPPPPQAPVQIIEPTSGWWRNAGKFGQRFQGRPPDIEGELIALTEQLELPGPPAPWWFNFFRYDRSLQDEIVTNGNWELRARLIYGVGGAQNVIETDLLQGMQFPVVCNSVTVQLRTYAPSANAPYSVTADAEVVAGVMFGKGAGNGALPVTWTTPFSEVQPAVNLELRFPIPDFARSLVVHTDQTVQAGLDATVIRFRNSNGVIKEMILGDAYAVLSQEKGIAIPGNANQVELTAATATNVSRVFGIQFFLGL